MLAAIGAAILLPSALAQTTTNCPQGQREHKDDNGKLWCIDSEGRSFAVELPQGITLPYHPGHSVDGKPELHPDMPVKPFVGGTIRTKNSKGEFEDCNIEGRNPDGSVAYYLCPSDRDDTLERLGRLGSCEGSYEDSYQAEKSMDGSYRLARETLSAKDYARLACFAGIGVKQGDRRAFTLLGIIYSKQEYSGFDKEKAFQYLRQAADKGDPKGEYLLSLAYTEGMGTQADEANAGYWMSRAMATEDGRSIDAQVKQRAMDERFRQQGVDLLLPLLRILIGGDDSSQQPDCAMNPFQCGQSALIRSG